VYVWSDGRSRGQVVCQVPPTATHVSYVCFSPDDQLIALSADKLIYIIDVKVCITVFDSKKMIKEFTYYHRA